MTEDTKEKTQESFQIRYCSYCGEEMMTRMRSADENMLFYGDEITMPYESRYNKKTGKRQYCPYYKCRDYKNKRWYQIGGSPHDEYFLDEVWVESNLMMGWEKLDK